MSVSAMSMRLVPRIGRRIRSFGLIRDPLGLLACALLVLIVLVATIGSIVTPYAPVKIDAGPTLAAPSLAHWAGTDELGRDVFARAASGARVSLIVGVTAALIAAFIGVTIGATAGFLGGRIEDSLMRFTEAAMVIPRFFLAIVIVSLFGAGLVNMIFAISVLSWPVVARIVRAEVLSVKRRQFIDAARVMGVSRPRILFGEILPNVTGPIVVTTTLLVGESVLIEAALSYLGLGDPENVSLGLLLQQSQPIMRIAWWAAAFPGLLLFAAVLSVNLLGDTINRVLDPRSRSR